LPPAALPDLKDLPLVRFSLHGGSLSTRNAVAAGGTYALSLPPRCIVNAVLDLLSENQMLQNSTLLGVFRSVIRSIRVSRLPKA